MKDWYIKMMEQKHNSRDFTERNTYAIAAGVDIIKYFYLKRCDNTN